MQKAKHWLLTVAVLMCSLTADAHDFEVDGIYYNIISEADLTVAVTYEGDELSSSYSDDVEIPNTVEYNNSTYHVVKIDRAAFHECVGLLSVKIPSSVVEIGGVAFEYCYALENIEFSEGSQLETIGEGAFYMCQKLQSISIPSLVKDLSASLFGNCSGLVEVNYEKPENIMSIGNETFMNCSSLNAIEIPKNVKVIGERCFSGCTLLEEVVFAQECVLETIGNGTFSGCSSLLTINIPTKVCLIGKNAFYGCSSMKNITLPTGITTIEDDTFGNCSALLNILIPQNVETLDYGCFSGCSSLQSVVFDNAPRLATIGTRTFYGCKSLKDIVIPKSVINIQNNAFQNCQLLAEVSFEAGSTLHSIGASAFSSCTGLKSIKIPSSVAEINSNAFQSCTSLSNCSFEENSILTAIGDYAFNNTAISEITLPSNLQTLGNYCFRKSANLTTVLFESDSQLTSIGKYAFYETALSSVELPLSLQSIGTYAFGKCNITSVVIPSNVSEIGEAPFGYSENLVSISVDENNAMFDSRNDCNAIIETATNTLIAGISTTEIPIGTQIIASNAFTLSGTMTVNIPSSVIEIENYAFYSCKKLTAYLYSNPKTSSYSFRSNNVAHLILKDDADFDSSNKNTYASMSYNRELQNSKYGTIILPFVPDASSLENYAFYSLTSADNNTLTFDEVETPEANTPYLFALREGTEEVGAIKGGQTTIMSDIIGSAADDWQMVGSFTNQTIVASEDEDRYYYAYTSSDNKIHQVTNTLTVKPYRAYFTTSSTNNMQLAVRTRSGEETLIDAAEVEGLSPEVYYDLSGRRVDNPVKGVYIVNGKKVVF